MKTGRADRIAAAWAGPLVAAPLVAWHPAFNQLFLVPKQAATLAAGAAALVYLAVRGRIGLPSRGTAWFGLAVILGGAVCGLRGEAPVRTATAFALLIAPLAIWAAACQLDAVGRARLLAWIVAAGVGEAVVAGLQAAFPGRFLSATVDSGHPGMIGTVGNQEFLATVCGVAGLAALELRRLAQRKPWRRRILAAAAVACAAGLLLARNKGGVLLLAGWGLWRARLDRRLFAGLAVAGAMAVVIALPESVRGRLHLVAAGLWIMKDHALAGVGLDGYANHYLDAVYDLHTRYPALAAALGSHTGDIRDAHNLFLEYGIALGVTGLLLSGALAWYTGRRGWAAGGFLGAALGFLLAKSFYTVVLGSVSGAVLWAVCLAVAGPLKPGFTLPVAAVPYRLALLLPLAHFAWCGGATAVADRAYGRGMRALARGDSAEAECRFLEAARANPDSGEAELSLGFIEFQARHWSAMDPHLHRAMAAERTVDVTKKSAHMWFFSRQYDKAEPIYRWLAVAMPDRRSPLIKLALIAQARGRRDEARALALKVITMRPRVYNPNDAGYLEDAHRIFGR